ncbi:MAG: ribosome small subunit-dependent GTPase A [Bacteroidales bacterium]|nr:ribosome small subunit-dependent GTPase A [Bacteroidales bacterium]
MEKRVATVVKHTGSHYLLSELPEWNVFPAVMRGVIRLKKGSLTNPVAVGDKVEYTREGDIATIETILPRKNYIIRRSTNLSKESHIIAANLDRVFLVISMVLPEPKLPFIDRFLVTCEAYGVPVTIVINKTDLEYLDGYKESVEWFKSIYQGAGYEIMEVSALRGDEIDTLRDKCKERVSLFSGVSGVGKSSLIKAIAPELTNIKTGEISMAHLQGKHTTTFYEMHPLSTGGFIIDAPGIRGFGLIDLEKESLSTYFPEMLRVMDDCRFKPCTHTHEPGCAVKKGVEDGIISAERYNSYLSMLEDENKYRK